MSNESKYVIYILRLPSNRLYIGVSRDVQKRLATHKSSKGAKYTKYCKKPILVYTEQSDTLTTAMQREKQIKRWSRAKKEALISNNLDLLKSL